MNQYEQDYIALVNQVIESGESRSSRVGTTSQMFGTQLVIDELAANRFPLLTTRKMFPAPIFGELAAFLRGSSSLATFKELGCNYWDDNAKAWPINAGLTDPNDMYLGRIYGVQWRYWNNQVNQLQKLTTGLEKDPFGRRHIITAWNPAELHEMCLPPCHILAQFNVARNLELDCMVTMRSVDLCLGLPADVVLYATMSAIVAQQTGYAPGRLIFSMGDTHVYHAHLKSWQEQCKRPIQELPFFALKEKTTVDNFLPSNIEIVDYNPASPIKYELLT